MSLRYLRRLGDHDVAARAVLPEHLQRGVDMSEQPDRSGPAGDPGDSVALAEFFAAQSGGGSSARRPPAPVEYPLKQSNRAARAGLILSVLCWPLGLVFSLLGLARSGRRGGAGRIDAVVGLVLTLVFAVVSIGILEKVLASSYPGDPGCVGVSVALTEVHSSELTLDTQFAGGEYNIQSGQGAASLTELQRAGGALTASAGKARHSQVANALGAVRDDVAADVQQAQSIVGSGYGSNLGDGGRVDGDIAGLAHACGIAAPAGDPLPAG